MPAFIIAAYSSIVRSLDWHTGQASKCSSSGASAGSQIRPKEYSSRSSSVGWTGTEGRTSNDMLSSTCRNVPKRTNCPNRSCAELALCPLVGRARGSSQTNCAQSSLRQFFLTEFTKTGLGSGFEQPKLGLGKSHFGTDFFLALLVKVEAGKDLTK